MARTVRPGARRAQAPALLPDLSGPRRSVPAMTAETVDLPLPVLGSLSPSRAGDFMTCPLLFRFRTSTGCRRRRPRPPPAAPSCTRSSSGCTTCPPPSARSRPLPACCAPSGSGCSRPSPTSATLFEDEQGLTAWLASARDLLAGYFSLEDPTRLEPAERERLVEVVLPGGLRLRGIVDRLDRAPERRPAGRRLQDRPRARRDVRGQGAVPDEVLRAGAVAHDRRRAAAAPADVPRRPRGPALLPRRGRPAGDRAQAARPVGGHRAGDAAPRVPAASEQAVRLVRPPGAVPELRRDAPAVPRRRARAGRPAAAPAGGRRGGRAGARGDRPDPAGVRAPQRGPSRGPALAGRGGRPRRRPATPAT